jgi:DNA polymerase-3 subunit epsilon
MTTERSLAIQKARELISLHPLYLDTETTGIETFSEIVEICLIDDDGSLVYESLVKPTGRIPFDVIQIHGITDEMVRNAPRWMEVWPEVEKVLSGRQIGVYNSDFDLRMMQQTHGKYRMRWQIPPETYFFCIMKLYARYYGEWNRGRGSYRWHSLEMAGRHCKIPLPNTHRARDDTQLARAILHHMAHSS